MTRGLHPNSRTCYHALQAAGRLCASRTLVLNAVAKAGENGSTCADLAYQLTQDEGRLIGANQVIGRLTELERLELVERYGSAKSQSTGKPGELWMATARGRAVVRVEVQEGMVANG